MVEAATGRWAIGQNRKYLWGNRLYWICDCSAIKEILEYSGTIQFVTRWAQELLGYDFVVVHRCSKMMADVDALSRRYGELLGTHLVMSQCLKIRDMKQRPASYR